MFPVLSSLRSAAAAVLEALIHEELGHLLQVDALDPESAGHLMHLSGYDATNAILQVSLDIHFKGLQRE